MLLALAVYWPVLSSNFITMDDGLYVTENRHVRAGLTTEGVVWAFSNGEAGMWHPVTWLSHMLDCQLFGLNPTGHHFTSLALHIANTVLLFLLLRLMTQATWPAAVVAALFAVHPLRVESVAWIAERKDVLSVFFGLLTLRAYVRYSARPSVWGYVPVALLFALGLMAKPMLVTLPGVLLLLDYWPLGRSAPAGANPSRELSTSPRSVFGTQQPARPVVMVLEKLPLVAMALMCIVVTLITARRNSALTTLEAFPLSGRIGNAVVSYARYLGKTIWPAHLAVFYPLEASPPASAVLTSASMLLAVSLLAFVSRHRCPYVIVGWLWFIGTLVPVIGLVQAGPQAMADRFTYLPLTGLLITAVWGAAEACGQPGTRRRAMTAIACLVIAACAGVSRWNVAYWHDGERLFSHALEVTGSNWLVHDSLGDALLKEGDIDGAGWHFQEAIRLHPGGYAHGEYNLGVVLALQRRLAEAEARFREAVRLQPNYADAEFNLGNALARQGRASEAIPYLREAVRDAPRSPEAHAGLGTALLNMGSFQEAALELSEAVRLKPDFAVAHYNLARALELQGSASSASDHYQRAFTLDPDLRAGAANR